MRNKFVVRYLADSGSEYREEFTDIDSARMRYDEVIEEDRYLYADLENHIVQNLKSAVKG